MNTANRRLYGPRFRLVVMALVVAVAMVVWPSPPVVAAMITVTTTADELNTDGDCALREALQAANSDQAVDACPAGNGADTIILPAGTYGLPLAGTSLPGVYITADLTITGAGAATTQIDAMQLDLAVVVLSAVNVTITSVTIRHGSAVIVGGGILNQGNLTLNDVWVTGNHADAYQPPCEECETGGQCTNADGGGINNSGTLLMRNSTISDNMAGTDCDQFGSSDGGGLFNTGVATIINSTVTENVALGNGAGIYNAGTLTIDGSTIAANMGVGLFSAAGTTTVRNSILANSSDSSHPSRPDCTGTLTSQGYNLIENPAGCTIVGDPTGHLLGVDPRLGPLQDNGGPTETVALLSGSPAIDAANPTAPGADPTACPVTDQRGIARPQDGDGNGSARCDIGAFELTGEGGGNVFLLPTTIEAEDYQSGGEGVAYHDTTPGNRGGAYREDDVDIQSCGSDCYNVGWVRPGEWLAYAVRVPAADYYQFSVRVASPHDARNFHIELNGQDVSGPLTVPNTGDWFDWVAVHSGRIPIEAGDYELRLVFDSGDFNVDALTVAHAPIQLPARLEAEDFALGGEGIGYHDSTSRNLGGSYRPAEAVDIELTTDGGGGFNVGWMTAGEWLAYKVRLAPDTILITARVASPLGGNTFHLEWDGQAITGPIGVPSTGGWQRWVDVPIPPLALPWGEHELRFVSETGGMNLNYLQVSPTVELPGRIQAENFKLGGEGQGYHDSTTANVGGAYRLAEGVDIEPTSDGTGHYNVGWIAAGEWLEYDVRVPVADHYHMEVRVASPLNGKRFHLELSGRTTSGVLVGPYNISGSVLVPNTGDWQRWTTVTIPSVWINPGSYRLRLVAETGEFNVNFIVLR